MKYIFTFSLLVLVFSFSSNLCAQQATSFTNQADQPNGRPAPNRRFADFVPGEVLVKFKDDVVISAGNNLKSSGINSVDKILKSSGGISLEKLFPTEKRLKSVQIVKDPQGQDMKIPSLHNIYKITLTKLKSSGSSPADIFTTIEELKALPEVEYAEPNYIFSVDDLSPVGPVLTSADVLKLQEQTHESTIDGSTPNDPLYSQQWYIPAVKADLVWAQTTGDTSQVIAILDTGIDWKHPDLMNKIWINKDEVPDNGIDDDGDGLADDIRGWDYINNDNNPMDDNSHGTHVAGIAAAETNNGIGIAGVCPKAKIMPIKVFQSSGRGDAATITKGIIYASAHGATVINMSFGSYTHSMAMEDALANAYATSVLVAAAGNDGGAIELCTPVTGPFFPAALSFVLGVQAPDGAFSNFDCNGPTFSNFQELFNYEMKAPGTNIISTIPNGNYRVYQGTSMAAPLISGAVSLYRSIFPQDVETQEFMWVKLIQATGQYLDINKALTIVPKPEVWFLNNVMVDTLGLDDNDGRVDAGETIQLWFRARNTGGQVDSVYWKIRLAEFEDKTTCTIVKPTSFLGSISPYATRTSEKDPMVFKISPNVAHDRDITFDLLCWYKGSTDTLRQTFVFTAENGKNLAGVMDTTLVLTPDKLWIVNNSFKIGQNGKLIMNPGVNIILNKAIINYGVVSAIGTKENNVKIFGPEAIKGPGITSTYETTFFDLNNSNWNSSAFGGIGDYQSKYFFKNTTFENLQEFHMINNFDSLIMVNCIFRNFTFYMFANNIHGGIKIIGGTFDNIFLKDDMGYGWSTGNIILENTNFNRIKGESPTSSFVNTYASTMKNNNFITNDVVSIVRSSQGFFDYQPNNYWGSTLKEKIEKKFFDFWDDSQLSELIFEPKLTQPSASAHAIVWKVLVNNKDAQDEYVEPVGLGKQRFDVYFNRPMNKSMAPQVAFGVRYPFNSNAVNEEGTWSADGRVYTAYKTVKLFTGDGINRFRVTGAKDLDGWEIPVEDSRFNFLISAANSASIDFMATPSLGKVNLEWNGNNLEDGLGYNMYRMEHINDSTLTAPILVNSTMITDTLYTDFSVVPNKKYYYYYKILRTNLAETDSSKVVSAIPFTASRGDANGDLSVNVLDVTTIVSYLLNQNPQPFIFEAADINSDKTINILDVIGAVNKITGGGKKSVTASTNIPPAYIYLDKNEISFKTQYPVSALQFELEGNGIDKITLSSKQKEFELVYSAKEGKITGILFSFDNKSLPTELSGIISLQGDCSGLKWGNLLGGDAKGNPVKVIPDELHTVSLADCNLSAFPNPFSQGTTIKYSLHEAAQVQLEIYDMYGRLIQILLSADQQEGEYQQIWKGTNSNGSTCKQGFYFCHLTAKTTDGKIIEKTTKLLRIEQ